MNRRGGFSLVELLVVVAIIGILAAVALPSYNDYIVRGRIADVVSTIANMQIKLEQHFLDSRDYTTACAANSIAPLPPDTAYFRFTCSNLSQTSYQFDATGQTGSVTAGFQYRLTPLGKTTVSVPSGWAGVNSSCFVLRRTGEC